MINSAAAEEKGEQSSVAKNEELGHPPIIFPSKFCLPNHTSADGRRPERIIKRVFVLDAKKASSLQEKLLRRLENTPKTATNISIPEFTKPSVEASQNATIGDFKKPNTSEATATPPLPNLKTYPPKLEKGNKSTTAQSNITAEPNTQLKNNATQVKEIKSTDEKSKLSSAEIRSLLKRNILEKHSLKQPNAQSFVIPKAVPLAATKSIVLANSPDVSSKEVCGAVDNVKVIEQEKQSDDKDKEKKVSKNRKNKSKDAASNEINSSMEKKEKSKKVSTNKKEKNKTKDSTVDTHVVAEKAENSSKNTKSGKNVRKSGKLDQKRSKDVENSELVEDFQQIAVIEILEESKPEQLREVEKLVDEQLEGFEKSKAIEADQRSAKVLDKSKIKGLREVDEVIAKDFDTLKQIKLVEVEQKQFNKTLTLVEEPGDVQSVIQKSVEVSEKLKFEKDGQKSGKLDQKQFDDLEKSKPRDDSSLKTFEKSKFAEDYGAIEMMEQKQSEDFQDVGICEQSSAENSNMSEFLGFPDEEIATVDKSLRETNEIKPKDAVKIDTGQKILAVKKPVSRRKAIPISVLKAVKAVVKEKEVKSEKSKELQITKFKKDEILKADSRQEKLGLDSTTASDPLPKFNESFKPRNFSSPLTVGAAQTESTVGSSSPIPSSSSKDSMTDGSQPKKIQISILPDKSIVQITGLSPRKESLLTHPKITTIKNIAAVEVSQPSSSQISKSHNLLEAETKTQTQTLLSVRVGDVINMLDPNIKICRMMSPILQAPRFVPSMHKNLNSGSQKQKQQQLNLEAIESSMILVEPEDQPGTSAVTTDEFTSTSSCNNLPPLGTDPKKIAIQHSSPDKAKVTSSQKTNIIKVSKPQNDNVVAPVDNADVTKAISRVLKSELSEENQNLLDVLMPYINKETLATELLKRQQKSVASQIIEPMKVSKNLPTVIKTEPQDFYIANRLIKREICEPHPMVGQTSANQSYDSKIHILEHRIIKRAPESDEDAVNYILQCEKSLGLDGKNFDLDSDLDSEGILEYMDLVSDSDDDRNDDAEKDNLVPHVDNVKVECNDDGGGDLVMDDDAVQEEIIVEDGGHFLITECIQDSQYMQNEADSEVLFEDYVMRCDMKTNIESEFENLSNTWQEAHLRNCREQGFMGAEMARSGEEEVAGRSHADVEIEDIIEDNHGALSHVDMKLSKTGTSLMASDSDKECRITNESLKTGQISAEQKLTPVEDSTVENPKDPQTCVDREDIQNISYDDLVEQISNEDSNSIGSHFGSQEVVRKNFEILEIVDDDMVEISYSPLPLESDEEGIRDKNSTAKDSNDEAVEESDCMNLVSDSTVSSQTKRIETPVIELSDSRDSSQTDIDDVPLTLLKETCTEDRSVEPTIKYGTKDTEIYLEKSNSPENIKLVLDSLKDTPVNLEKPNNCATEVRKETIEATPVDLGKESRMEDINVEQRVNVKQSDLNSSTLTSNNNEEIVVLVIKCNNQNAERDVCKISETKTGDDVSKPPRKRKSSSSDLINANTLGKRKRSLSRRALESTAYAKAKKLEEKRKPSTDDINSNTVKDSERNIAETEAEANHLSHSKTDIELKSKIVKETDQKSLIDQIQNALQSPRKELPSEKRDCSNKLISKEKNLESSQKENIEDRMKGESSEKPTAVIKTSLENESGKKRRRMLKATPSLVRFNQEQKKSKLSMKKGDSESNVSKDLSIQKNDIVENILLEPQHSKDFNDDKSDVHEMREIVEKKDESEATTKNPTVGSFEPPSTPSDFQDDKSDDQEVIRKDYNLGSITIKELDAKHVDDAAISDDKPKRLKPNLNEIETTLTLHQAICNENNTKSDSIKESITAQQDKSNVDSSATLETSFDPQNEKTSDGTIENSLLLDENKKSEEILTTDNSEQGSNVQMSKSDKTIDKDRSLNTTKKPHQSKTEACEKSFVIQDCDNDVCHELSEDDERFDDSSVSKSESEHLKSKLGRDKPCKVTQSDVKTRGNEKKSSFEKVTKVKNDEKSIEKPKDNKEDLKTDISKKNVEQSNKNRKNENLAESSSSRRQTKLAEIPEKITTREKVSKRQTKSNGKLEDRKNPTTKDKSKQKYDDDLSESDENLNEIKQKLTMPKKAVKESKVTASVSVKGTKSPEPVMTETIVKRKPGRPKRTYTGMNETVDVSLKKPRLDSDECKSSQTSSLDKTKTDTNVLHPRLFLVDKRSDLDIEVVEETPQNSVPAKGIICGMCKKVLQKNTWTKHQRLHYGLSWIQGKEDPLDLTNLNQVVNKMLYFMREYSIKSWKCRFCQEERKSALGLISHMRDCGVPKIDRQMNCEYCNKLLAKAWIHLHYKTCIGFRAKMVEAEKVTVPVEPTEPVFSLTGRVKRQSVLKAETSFKEVLGFDPDMHVKPLKRSIPILLARWRTQISRTGKAICSSCNFRAGTTEAMLAHDRDCKKIIRTGFVCTTCKFTDKSEKVVIQHAEKHRDQQDFSGSESDAEIDSEGSSGDDGFSSGKDDEGEDILSTRSRKYVLSKDVKWKQLLYDSFENDDTNFQEICANFTREFREKNYFQEAIFKDAIPMVSTASTNLFESFKEKNPKSNKFSYKGDAESVNEWKDVEYFNVISYNDENLIFLGNSITAIAWVPVLTSVQYLVVASRQELNTAHKLMNHESEKCLITVIEVSKSSDQGENMRNVRILYTIECDDGPINDMVFLPSGGYCLDINRLGLLALATAKNFITIYALPIHVEESIEINNGINIIRLMPSIVLCLRMDESLDDFTNSQCLAIVWSEFKGHEIIAAGFANGFIGIWSLNEESLNVFRRNGIRNFVPIQYFRGATAEITYLQFHYDMNGVRWLLLTNCGRDVKTYDLSDVQAVRLISNQEICKNATGLVWPINLTNHYIGTDGTFNRDRTGILAQNTIHICYKSKLIIQCPAWISCVAYSTWHHTIIFGTFTGDLFMQKLRNPIRDVLTKTTNNRRLIYQKTEVKRLDGRDLPKISVKWTENNVDENIDEVLQICDINARSKYGLVFDDTIKKMENQKFCDPLPAFIPLTRITRIAFNTNSSLNELFAFGYQCGILKIRNLK